MTDRFTEELRTERENLARLLLEARAGRRSGGDTLGTEGSKQLAEAIQQAIDSLDTSLKIIADLEAR